ncbi:MAG: V-type ATP synthase subunit I [Angelakisella sp.]|jgi:V/A-type H+-transporting ATPase subunit I|nr:V-type ATP synthase subunit I [Angelakisella sp.]MCI9528645.1 V-type ATP synthase subunit I [Angelakisella sp.]
MSIEKMSLVMLRGEAAQLDEVLLRCLDSGVFHPENAGSFSEYAGGITTLKEENPYTGLGKKLSAIAAETDIDLGSASFEGLDIPNGEFQGYIGGLDQKLKKLLSKKRGSEQLIESHKTALRRLEHFTSMELNFDSLFACKYIKVRFGRLPLDSYQKLRSYSDRPFVLFSFGQDSTYNWCLYTCAVADAQEIDGLFQSLYFERIRVPDYVHGTPQEALEFIRKDLAREEGELESIKGKIAEIAAGERERVQKLYAKLCLLGKAFELRDKAAFVKSGFVVMGCVPQKQSKKFALAFQDLEDKVTVTLKEPAEEPRITVPVRLKNNWFVKPFEMFVDMYGLPSYQDIDPTPYVAATYILLFGIMFGDLGQGLLVSLLGAFLYKKKGMAIGGIMSRIGLSSMVFGFLYGSVFGFEELLIPVHQAIFGRPHLIQVMEGSYTNFLLLAAVGIGAVITVVSIGFNILLGLRRKDWERVFFSNNGLAGLVFYLSVLFAVAATMVLQLNVLTPVYILPLLVLPLLVMFAKEPLGRLVRGEKELFPEGVGGFVVENFFEMFEVLLSFVTNTMSFLRVGAFVLVHAGMMVVVFTLAGMVGGVASPVVIVAGNLFVAAMEGLIVGIQVLRLEFYEIFSRFYDGEGRPFLPAEVDYSVQEAA